MEYRCKVDVRVKAVEALQAHSGLPKGRIKDAMSKGAAWLHRAGKRSRIRRASRQVEPGDELALYYNPDLLHAKPPEPALLEDRTEYSVWHKPAGMLCSGSRYGDHHSIVRWVEVALGRPTQLVHRLDRFTAGVMVLAHGKSLARKLAKQFQDRSVKKTYQALVAGKLPQAIRVDEPIDGRYALSHVEPQAVLNKQTQVLVRIETGRKHQIRRHLAGLGHPVVGDVAYGGADKGDLQLVAVALELLCPLDGERVCFTLPRRWALF